MIDASEKRAIAINALAKSDSIRNAAKSIGVPYATFHGWLQPVIPGKLRPLQREIMTLPTKGRSKTYILTSAQNNTGLHEACWRNLLALAAHDYAEIMVASFTYATESRASIGQKLQAGKKTSAEPKRPVEWWDEKVRPYLNDQSIEIAPGLIWCGELQILPTAVDPISGMESYTGRSSSIIPHVKFAVRSVPSPKMKGTKFVYTTGAVTLRNYIQKKAGQKASFHHGYGAVIVEVASDGSWFVRQLNADSEGVIYDLDRKVDNGRVTSGHRPEALVWGDIHTRQLEPDMRRLGWGKGGILDTLRPKRQIMHDILDFRSQNHHDRKDPWKTYAKHVTKSTSVEAEIDEVRDFLNFATRDWCETVIAAANHDEALIRWLKEADFRDDPENAEFILEATWVAYRAMRTGDRKFYPLEWAVTRRDCNAATWLRRDQEYVVCDVELGMHGDKGANGSKGSIKGFAKDGRRCVVADSHTAALHEGAMQVGVMGSLDQGYNVGQSSWSHTNAIVYPNGKRTLFTIWKGRWHGKQQVTPERLAA